MKNILNNILVTDLFYKNSPIHDRIPISIFMRLVGNTEVSEELVTFSISGSLDNGKKIIKMKLDSNIPVICVNCLEKFNFKLKIDKIYITKDLSDKSLKKVTDEVLELDENFKLLDFIEDELILSVPFSPKHEYKCC
jgi:uncharacterized protein